MIGSLSGLALIEPTLDLLLQIPSHYTHRRIDYATLAEALRRTDPVFVKSADVLNKCLVSRVWEPGQIVQQAREISPNLPVLIAEPVAWRSEYRVIVLERRVVTFSPYMRHGVRAKVGDYALTHDGEETAEILAGCYKFLADPAVSIPPTCTLDVGLIEDRGWAVVEFNPVWCSRLFGCDRSRMLPVLQRACVSRAQMDATDSQWVRACPP
jgi:hypothetical protein